jgi:mannose/cellobiose epimerase-like protein (N-acyl-D-glucosamine 2-epimerase family)
MSELSQITERLTTWLSGKAYPLWAEHGYDWQGGGFYERLDATGAPVIESRRARVQPRQIFSYAAAPALGWQGDAQRICAHGLRYFHEKFRRKDGLAITLVDPNGAAKDSRCVLYDQTFVLLAYATVLRMPNLGFDPEHAARTLLQALHEQFRHSHGGFNSEAPPISLFQSNPHMHLFEATLAWMSVSESPEWRSLADELGELALARFIDSSTGALKEFFAPDWRPVDGTQGRIVEPGHQYEWAWLLMRWDENDRRGGRKAALKLIDIAEQHGVRDGFAINSLLDDFSVHDGGARLWPQTERIKAAVLAARLIGGSRFNNMACEAALALERYFETRVAGLWHDKRLPSGEFVAEPSPASSLYHIVVALSELNSPELNSNSKGASV